MRDKRHFNWCLYNLSLSVIYKEIEVSVKVIPNTIIESISLYVEFDKQNK